jgi:hypothetical protein
MNNRVAPNLSIPYSDLFTRVEFEALLAMESWPREHGGRATQTPRAKRTRLDQSRNRTCKDVRCLSSMIKVE